MAGVRNVGLESGSALRAFVGSDADYSIDPAAIKARIEGALYASMDRRSLQDIRIENESLIQRNTELYSSLIKQSKEIAALVEQNTRLTAEKAEMLRREAACAEERKLLLSTVSLLQNSGASLTQQHRLLQQELTAARGELARLKETLLASPAVLHHFPGAPRIKDEPAAPEGVAHAGGGPLRVSAQRAQYRMASYKHTPPHG